MELDELIATMAASIYLASPGHPHPSPQAREALMVRAVEEAKLLWKIAHERARQ